ncbi:hypothetical protein BJ878DRAFT_494663 [Calycina marina]|uniref:Uncharacterized protein n=1 Tax=Calycina marina TaxID=1763456 RepID=A0A9P8CJ09_9HELO|nr:hypothetical protein BJ878DRAFT_494663 [Calycina marina]
MFKWHVQSAIERSRPLGSDYSRVADGIAASLRLFSTSACAAADDEKPRFTISRRGQQNLEAIAELSAITPKSRGIDARALGAKPSGERGFRITRLDETGQRHQFNPTTGNRDFNPNFTRSRGGGMSRGRGGNRGAPKKRRGGRGNFGPRSRETHNEVDENESDEEPDDLPDYTMEELQWQRHMEGGYADGAYEPGTTLEALMQRGDGTAVQSSAQGVLADVMHKLRTGTGTMDGFRHASEHRSQILRGTGVTAFGSREDAKAGKRFLKERTSGLNKKRVDMQRLSEDDKGKLSDAWVAGHYRMPESPATLGDAVGMVGAYSIRNETYLPEDARKFEEKLRSLLPANFGKKSAAPKVAKRA